MVYKLMKNKIKKADLNNDEVINELQEMLDVFYAGERISTEEYQELCNMLAKE